jgi:flavin-dependent dehydrogenase
MRPLTIIGGGLAGLALGAAAQRKGMAVTVHEAGTLPRHRVCGEFLCGKGARVLQQLGLSEVLAGARVHRSTQWQVRGRQVLRRDLPEPALGLSRFLLDERLANVLRAAGGEVVLRSRIAADKLSHGWVCCSGRPANASDWIGLKFHCSGFSTQADLELHVAKGGYVGLSAIEAGQVNVCALVRRDPALQASGKDLLQQWMRHSGQSRLAARLADAEVVEGSHVGVAGIRFCRIPQQNDGVMRLGDAWSVIPPFTGNGMSMALESAAIALPWVERYCNHGMGWSDACGEVHDALLDAFGRRLRAARMLHPLLQYPAGHTLLSAFSRSGLLPFRMLYKLTH